MAWFWIKENEKKLLMIKVKYLQNILMTLLLEAVFFYKIRKEYSKQCREFKQDLI